MKAPRVQGLAMQYDQCVDHDEILSLMNLLQPYRQHNKIIIPLHNRERFCQEFYFITGIKIKLSHSLLTLQETLCLALTTSFGYADISNILGITKNKILYEEKKAKIKLGAKNKVQSICMAVQHNCFSFPD